MTKLRTKVTAADQASPATQAQDLPSMTPTEMVAHLKALRLGQVERSKVMETFRDAGQAEALEQAQNYVATNKAAAARTKAAVRRLLGITI